MAAPPHGHGRDDGRTIRVGRLTVRCLATPGHTPGSLTFACVPCRAGVGSAAMSDYPHLFSPLRIGNVTVRNRIMQTAHVKLFAAGGVDSQRNVDYQAARAKGGAGLSLSVSDTTTNAAT